jgi:hypothetical protein
LWLFVVVCVCLFVCSFVRLVGWLVVVVVVDDTLYLS